MNYELAKKLKEVGFIQRGRSGKYYREPETLLPVLEDEHSTISNIINATPTVYRDPLINKVYVPTLDELIEACGVYSFSIHFNQGGPTYGGEPWFYIEHSGRNIKHSATRSEAVAKLWLELNKK